MLCRLRDSVSEMDEPKEIPPSDVLDTIGSAVERSFDDWLSYRVSDPLLKIISDTMYERPTILPPGSHLWLYDSDSDSKGKRGIGVVALRMKWVDGVGERAQVLTEAGMWSDLNENVVLRLGGKS